MIDPISAHGLAVRGDRLYRVIGCQQYSEAPASDLPVYDKAVYADSTGSTESEIRTTCCRATDMS